jgi:hypothetical protein
MQCRPSIHMLHFTEDGNFEIKNKYVVGIKLTLLDHQQATQIS